MSFLAFAGSKFLAEPRPGYLKTGDEKSGLNSWSGRHEFQVNVTKASTQSCHVTVQAHSADEAETLVRGMAVDELRLAEPRHSIDYKVLPR